jgi:hypothetical protein
VNTHLWHEYETTLTATRDFANPYTDVQLWAEFVHDDGTVLRRPGFWDGGRTWKLRFAPPKPGHWTWHSACDIATSGLGDHSGDLHCTEDPSASNRFFKHGFWRMSPGARNLVHADGLPALLAADTCWALPWRATLDDCRFYAQDRHTKGFNAVLLMNVQPDMRAVGPRERGVDEGFAVGFEDLPNGHINQLNPDYFQYFDSLVDILIDHEIVPVHQPVFHGFGWKGLGVAGVVVPPIEYARFCHYLVARYGARPAIWLVGGDGSGYAPQVPAGGTEVEQWDAYKQPTGIHYRPHADNRAFQDADWLDFQWCQTGHMGEHMPERVADMWRNLPVKAVANGEPTYENTARLDKAAGWWQGHEAWSNLCAGGTMGVMYGAGSLWHWVQRVGEPGQAAFFCAPGATWRDALNFEGSRYVGLLQKILQGLPTTDMAPDWTTMLGRRGLSVPGKLLISYVTEGGPLNIYGDNVPRRYVVIDPRSGALLRTGELPAPTNGANSYRPVLEDLEREPRVIIFFDGDINMEPHAH